MSLPPPAPSWLNVYPARPEDVRRMMIGLNIFRKHLTGPEARMLMRMANTTIRGVAKRYGITQKRIREIRTVGTSGYFSTCEWITNLCDNQCFCWQIHDEYERAERRRQERAATRPSLTSLRR